LATITSSPAGSVSTPVTLPGRRYDHYFFSVTAVLMLLTVFFGFARSYFLVGVFHAPLPSPIIHIHGALFTIWMILLLTQTSLVAAGRKDIHRRLGVAGFFLASLMVVAGLAAGTDTLLRRANTLDPFGRDPKMFYIIPVTDMVIFGAMVAIAFFLRRESAAHKRSILIANTTIMVAAIARLPFAFSARNNPVDSLLSDLFIVALVIYDLWSTRKLHRITLWGGLFLITVQQIRVPIGKTAAWHSVADWVIAHLR
jgi:FtsH-binding integral membrane protein